MRAVRVGAIALSEKDPNAVAVGILGRSLDFGGRKAHVQGREAIAAALVAGNRAAYDAFRYGLAREIGGYLGSAIAGVKTVYLIEPDIMPSEVNGNGANLTRSLDLIVWLDRREGAAGIATEALEEALLAEYKALLGPAVAAMRSLLSVAVVDDQDVQDRVGAASSIHSIHTPPTKAWSRFVIRLNPEYCGGCRMCSTVCPFEAITIDPEAAVAKIDPEKCQSCGICYSVCPSGAIESAYYDFSTLTRGVEAFVRQSRFKAISVTCRGSAPTAQEIEGILGTPDFLSVCLPCAGRTPTEFFLKAYSMGIEKIALIPCKDDHCRFEAGSTIIHRRVMLLQSLLRDLNYAPDALVFREAQGPLATVDPDLCSGCGTCMSVCPYDAIVRGEEIGEGLAISRIEPSLCQGCGACVVACPSKAISLDRFADLHMISQIEAAMATLENRKGPRVLGFVCNWCVYGEPDLPYETVHYGENIEVIRVPCAGRVDPLHILWAFLNGADGVFVGGCPADDCRYVSGPVRAEDRMTRLSELLAARGFDPKRLRLESLDRNSPEAFGAAIRSFVTQVQEL